MKNMEQVAIQHNLLQSTLQVLEFPNLYVQLVNSRLNLIDSDHNIMSYRDYAENATSNISQSNYIFLHRGMVLADINGQLIDAVSQTVLQKQNYVYTPNELLFYGRNQYFYFSHQNELHVKKKVGEYGSPAVCMIHNGKHKITKENVSHFVQFCDQLFYLTVKKDKTVLINNEVAEEFDFVPVKMNKMGGILHFQNNKKLYVINLLTKAMKIVKEDHIKKEDVEMGAFGEQLNIQAFDNLFGAGEYEKQQLHIKEYMTKFHSTFQDNCKKLIQFVEGADDLADQVQIQYKQKYLYDFQLTYLVKLNKNLNAFVAFEDGYMHLIDQNKKIISQTQIDFEFYIGFDYFRGVKRDIDSCVFDCNPYHYTPVICDNKLYIQYFNQILIFNDNKFDLVCYIPMCTTEAYYHTGCLFSVNSNIYCHLKHSDILYMLQDKQLVQVSEQYQIVSVCNKILTWKPFQSEIQLLDEKFQLIKLVDIHVVIYGLVLHLGDVCIFKSQSELFCVNFTGEVRKIDEYKVVLGKCGLQIEAYYNGKLISIPQNDYIQQTINNLKISFKDSLTISKQDYSTNMKRTKHVLKSLRLKVAEQQEILKGIKSLSQQMAERFTSIFREVGEYQ
ncbi:Hypothetical_protein [Hexamita inflata]|uniref:Hypothetical_protein n=1 Tax=Hexamita inflata TaxID=28002 RepID=A0ABP1GEB4_9EUKA